VQPFDGDLDDYQKWLLEQSREAAREQSKGDKKRKRDAAAAPAPAPVAAPAVAATPMAADRKAGAAQRQQRSEELKPLRKELNSVDNRLGVLMSDRDAAEAALAAPALTPAQRAEHGKRLKAIGDEIETLEARWLELSTRVDEMTGQPAG
jgi:ATP-binding cassette subfamily F protein 3